MSERYRQSVLPEDSFASVAVEVFEQEHPGADSNLVETLRESAEILERREHHPRQLDNVRGFLTAMIGFPTDIREQNIRRMNRPTRSGK